MATTSAAVTKLTELLALSTNDHFGNGVVCTADTWNNHIETGHPEMKGRLADVKAALEVPDKICTSTASAAAYIFCVSTQTGEELRAVVRYDDASSFQAGSTIGKLATSYVSDSVSFPSPQVGPPVYTKQAVAEVAAERTDEDEQGSES